MASSDVLALGAGVDGKVHVRGVVRVHVLHGGGLVSSGHKYVTGSHADLISPKGYSMMDISVAFVERNMVKPTVESLVNVLRAKDVDQQLAYSIATRVVDHVFKEKDSKVIVWLQTLKISWLDHVQRISGWSLASGVEVLPLHRGSSRGRRLAERPDWETIVDHIISAHEPSRLMVVGGKGVGKSTFLRFLTNRILSCSRSSSVVYVDLDPGQPELNLPGCLSATVISSPLLSPNCFNTLSEDHKCISSVYVGDVNVSNCTPRYRKALRHLQLRLSSNPELQNLPWLINTMGFNKGLGLTLLRESVCLLQPSVFVSIVSQSKSKNYDVDFRTELDEEVTKFFQFSAVPESCSGEKAPTQELQRNDQWGIPEPWRVRNLMILSYLCKNLRFFDLKPNVVYVPFESIVVQVLLDSKYPVENLFKLLNGSLVALNHVNRIELFELDKTTSWQKEVRLVDPREAKHVIGDCYGFGVIRAIQVNEKRFVLIVPDEIKDKSINCISLGSVQVPEEVFEEMSRRSQPLGSKAPYRSNYTSRNRLYNAWQRSARFKGNLDESKPK